MPFNDCSELDIIANGYLGFSSSGSRGALGVVVESDQALTDLLALTSELDLPYKAGYFYYHVKPLIGMLAEKDLSRIDLLFVPGHGTLHPRGYGIACEIADRLKIPVAGVARKLIYDTSMIMCENEYLSFHHGRKLVSTSGKPVYLSSGGYCNLEQLVQLVIPRLQPNGSLKGLQLARDLARRTLG